MQAQGSRGQGTSLKVRTSQLLTELWGEWVKPGVLPSQPETSTWLQHQDPLSPILDESRHESSLSLERGPTRHTATTR